MAKRKTRTKRKASAQREAIELPTPEQIMRGEAVREFVSHAETLTKAMAHKVAHDPVKRWHRDRQITDQEASTIERMQELWDAVHGQIRLSAAYSEPLGAKNASLGGLMPSEREITLKRALRAVEDEFIGLERWYSEFERICRFGGGLAGGAGARAKSLTTVRFVANIIAMKGLV